jgi:K+-transporting ATPase ATPase C chain
MLRRQLLTGLLMTVVMTVLLGLVYPLVVTGLSQVFMSKRAGGSLVKVNGKVVGSSLIGQNFTDANGNPLPKYFQSRPSAAGDGYDALKSGGSNLGPTNPKLIGNVPGVAIGDDGRPIKTNPYATAADPYCVPVQATDKGGNMITDSAGKPVYEKNNGTYACDPNTIPERAMAYRSLNGLASDALVPVDAVTASASGLDPQISVQNARLQAARVARARNMPLVVVQRAIAAHTQGRAWGFLGEQTVNVLDLNLALDRTG